MSKTTKERKLFIVRSSPHTYPQTPQQGLFREALKQCGIVKGISRKELIEKMQTCIPQFWEKQKKGTSQPPSL